MRNSKEQKLDGDTMQNNNGSRQSAVHAGTQKRQQRRETDAAYRIFWEIWEQHNRSKKQKNREAQSDY